MVKRILFLAVLCLSPAYGQGVINSGGLTGGIQAPTAWVAGTYAAGASVTYTPSGGLVTTYVSAVNGNTATPGSSGNWLAYSDGPGAAAQVQANLTAEATARAAADSTNATAAAAAQTTANAAVQRAGDTMTGPLSMNTSTGGTPDNVQALGQATSAGDANVPLAGATAGGVLYANLAEMYGLGGWAESINGGAYSLLARWSDLASPPSAALCQTKACAVTLAPGSTATTDTNGSQMLFFTSTNTGSSAGIPAGDVCSGVAAFVATGNYNENVWCSDNDPTVAPATGTTNYFWYHSSGLPLASPSWVTPNGGTELTSGGTWKAQIDALGLVESAAPTATSSITLSTSYVTVPVNAASAALTITLPGTPTSGTMYFIIKTDSSANVVTVSGGSATLNYLGTIGTSTYSGLTAQGKYVRLMYLGSSLGWYVVGSN